MWGREMGQLKITINNQYIDWYILGWHCFCLTATEGRVVRYWATLLRQSGFVVNNC